MIKRPLAMSAVVFVIVLFILFFENDSIFWRNPVKSNANGEKQIAGFLQDDAINVYGLVSDYDYKNKYGQTTTELYLSDVHILVPTHTNDKSNTNSYVKSNIGDEINNVNAKEKGQWKKVSRLGQNILIYINKEETLSIGDSILLSGKLSFFEPATNPGQFDAEKYYKNKDTLFALKKAVIEKRAEKNRSLSQELKTCADRQEEKLDYFLSDAYASILKAMLLGNKKELDEETKELYQDNGIAHILAISGLHISMLGMAIYRLFKRLPIPHWISLIGSELFLLLYGCMVGFSASAFRAIGMFTFFLVSKISKRSYDMLTAVAFTGMIQLLIHPGYLFDCGFQLSYAAILGMGILLPAFQELIKEIKISCLQKGISILLPSLSVTLFTAPILVYHYHQLSFFSILLNVVVIPFVGLLLIAAIIMLAVSYVCMPLAWLCTIPIKLILGFYECSCRFLELFPIGQKNIAHPSLFVIFCYYFLFLAMTILVKKKRRMYQFLFPLVAALVLLFPKKHDFTIWMLDVGQGDCNVIFSKEGNCFVIDCGSTTEYNVGEKRLVPFLKYHGIGKVDAVFVTHADTDHMNGVIELLECGTEENIEVSCVVVHEQNRLKELAESACIVEGTEEKRDEIFVQSSEIEKWKQLVEVAQAAGVPIVQMGQGDCVQTDSMSLTCLYPLDGQQGLTGNASSMVLELEAEASAVNKDMNEIVSGVSAVNKGIYEIVSGASAVNKDIHEIVGGNSAGVVDKFRADHEGVHILEECKNGVFRALFTGDLESEGERLLLEEYQNAQEWKDSYLFNQSDKAGRYELLEAGRYEYLEKPLETDRYEPLEAGQYELLKVGHHGSSGSSSAEFLEWATPRLAVISCGKDNPYGHPHQETLSRLENAGNIICSTAEFGAISVEFDGKVEVKYWGESN